jgi:hypothetical protein
VIEGRTRSTRRRQRIPRAAPRVDDEAPIGAAQPFGVSFALGDFFAGTVLRESEFRHRAALETLPLRDVFEVLLSVSVGRLFDLRVLIDELWKVSRRWSASSGSASPWPRRCCWCCWCGTR